MLAVFDVLCDCSLLIAAIIGFGPSAKPALQPVIAYVFDSEPSTMMCSLQSVNDPPLTISPGEVEIHIALIEQHKDPTLMRQPDNRLKILRRNHRTRRIRRRIQNDRLGLRRNRRLDHLAR